MALTHSDTRFLPVYLNLLPPSPPHDSENRMKLHRQGITKWTRVQAAQCKQNNHTLSEAASSLYRVSLWASEVLHNKQKLWTAQCVEETLKCSSQFINLTWCLRFLAVCVSQFTCIGVHSFNSLSYEGPKPLPNRALDILRSRASSFKWEYPVLSLRSSSNFLRLLPRLLVTSIPHFPFSSLQ